MNNTIDLYQAIKQMRAISKKQGSFSLAFMSYSRTRGSSHGIVEIGRARLLKGDYPKGKYSDHMLNYVDLDTGEAHRLWQPLLMYFNGTRIKLN